MKKLKFYDPMYFANVVVEIAPNDGSLLSGALLVRDRKTKKGLIREYGLHLDSKKDFYGLMHECLHLATNVMVDRGIPFDKDNDEVIAYYQLYWFKRLWRAINKK